MDVEVGANQRTGLFQLQKYPTSRCPCPWVRPSLNTAGMPVEEPFRVPVGQTKKCKGITHEI